MHKFILNVAECINLTHYGMFLYPDQSGYRTNTISVITVSSFASLAEEAIPEITEYIKLHPFQVENFAVCICARMEDMEDPRFNWLYFQMAAEFFRCKIEQLVGRCVGVHVLIHAMVPSKSNQMWGNLTQQNVKGVIAGHKDIYPDLTSDKWNQDDEKGIPALCDEVMGQLKDPVSSFVYIPLFQRIKEDSELLQKGTTTEQQERYFSPDEFDEGAEVGDPEVVTHCTTAKIIDRFQNFYREKLLEWDNYKIDIVVRGLVKAQPDAEIREGVTLACYLSTDLSEDYDVFAEKLFDGDRLIESMAAYHSRLERLDQNIPLCRPENSLMENMCIPLHVSVLYSNNDDEKLSEELGEFFKKTKNKRFFAIRNEWADIAKQIKKSVREAEESLIDTAEKMSDVFQKRKNYEKTLVRVSEIYAEKESLAEEAQKLHNKLAGIEKGNSSVKQLLRMMQEVENEDACISRLLLMLESAWLGSFIAVVLTCLLFLAIAYVFEQHYVFKTVQGVLTFFGYMTVSTLLFAASGMVVRWMIRRQIKKHIKELDKKFRDFREIYNQAGMEYAQRLTDMLQLEAITQRLSMIKKAEAEQQILARKWGWHRLKIQEHLRAMKHFESLIAHKTVWEEKLPELNPESDVIHNEAYWLILDIEEGEIK